jgi:AmmeMemoRadiSam system protein A
MALSRSLEPVPLSAAERRTLVAVAARALTAAVGERPPAPPVIASQRLRAPGASFVSLHRAGELRGCIGTIEPRRPLVEDVASNARAAALDDARFEPVVAAELGELEVELSVLSPLARVAARSRDELLAALRPGLDGLVLEDGGCRATFLPVVWRQLPEPELFLAHLERKAGLEVGHWSATLRVARSVVESFAGRAGGDG